MTYEALIVEQRGPVTLIQLNRPQALNALSTAVLTELIAAFAAFEADPAQGCAVLTGAGEKAFAAGADIKEMADKPGIDFFLEEFFSGWQAHLVRSHPQAVDRGGKRVCPGRGLRTGDDGRFHHRVRNREIRPARDQAGRGPRDGRVATPDPRGGQGQGDGHVPDRAHHGRGRGGTGRAGQPHRSGRATA